MNIFAVDSDPMAAATMLADTHVVKMVLESAQLLSTAHRVLDGIPILVGGKRVGWRLPDLRDSLLYKATHQNHPCAVWARESSRNYSWLYDHFRGLLNEYTYRYNKTHKCDRLVSSLCSCPDNIIYAPMTPMPMAMPDEFKQDDPVQAYRAYYRKGKSHLLRYKNRQPPAWLAE